MLIGDTAFQERQRWRRTIERTRALAQSSLGHQAWQVRDTLKSETSRGIANPTNPLDQMGRAMTSAQLIRILKLCNPNLVFEDSKNDKTKMVLLHPGSERQPDGGEKTVLRFLCAFEKGYMPEFSILHPSYEQGWDSEKKDYVQTLRSVRETRGWRTVVGRLLRARLISEPQVRKHFGHAERKNWQQWIT